MLESCLYWQSCRLSCCIPLSVSLSLSLPGGSAYVRVVCVLWSFPTTTTQGVVSVELSRERRRESHVTPTRCLDQQTREKRDILPLDKRYPPSLLFKNTKVSILQKHKPLFVSAFFQCPKKVGSRHCYSLSQWAKNALCARRGERSDPRRTRSIYRRFLEQTLFK